MRALLDSQQRWTKIYALSRRPPPAAMMDLLSSDQRARVQHVACDFLDAPDKIAQALKAAEVDASYIFFYSYVHKDWAAAEELVKANVGLFTNFLQALPLSNIQPKRFLLQTGAKNYGAHIGRVRTPLVESDPQPRHLEPNFYYPQEDLLKSYCRENNIGWNIIMPAAIIGAVNNAAMNVYHSYAVYAATQAYKHEPIAFPGDWQQWQYESHSCSARLTGYLSEWAVLEEKCKDQAFNTQNGGPLSWDRFYSELARWFGVEKGVVPPPDDDSSFQVQKGRAGADTPLGYGPPVVSRSSFTLTEWAMRPGNAQAWQTIMKESAGKVTDNPFNDIGRIFMLADFEIMEHFGSVSMNKTRRFGWTGFVDTLESIFEAYSDMAKLGMLPPMVVDAAKPLM